jgi:adenylylsulfate kinase
VDSIFLNGTVGTGKTTLAAAIGALEPGPHAVIDLDEIRRFRPSPAADRFNHELELANLRAIAGNYRRAGARRFVLAGVIESASEVPRYIDALEADGLFLCRLVASPEVIAARLVQRHGEDAEELAWHVARVGELADILNSSGMHDLVIETSRATPTELAQKVRSAAGWD